MENSDLKSMPIDELWQLHQQVAAKLARELASEKARLEERLHKLGSAVGSSPAPSVPEGLSQIPESEKEPRLGLAAVNNPAG